MYTIEIILDRSAPTPFNADLIGCDVSCPVFRTDEPGTGVLGTGHVSFRDENFVLVLFRVVHLPDFEIMRQHNLVVKFFSSVFIGKTFNS